MRPFIEFAIVIGVMLSVLAMFIIPLGFVMMFLNSLECSRQWENSGLLSKYETFGGCTVSKDGKIWLPSSAYREVM